MAQQIHVHPVVVTPGTECIVGIYTYIFSDRQNLLCDLWIKDCHDREDQVETPAEPPPEKTINQN